MKDEALAKTTRINLLFDFYEPLLTEKQRTFLTHYFHDDYSLGEIAENFGISRQAVYEHIKRAEGTLQEYEDKLGLVHKHEQRRQLLQQIGALLGGNESGGEAETTLQARRLLQELEQVD